MPPSQSLALCVALGLGLTACARDREVAGADAGGAGELDAGATVTGAPNILLIIADDLGLDASAQYGVSQDLPVTPTLNALAADGVVFDNAWATPACTTTRGTLISGKHGVHSGVTFVPAVLPEGTETLQSFLAAEPATSAYANAIFGKWHLGGAQPEADHPTRFGVGDYAGNLAGTIDDYEQWPLTRDGVTTTSTTYHTTKVTDLSIDWIAEQGDRPWFLWLAYVAPHSPFHLPPAHLHSRSLSGTAQDIAAQPRTYYLAAIEAMDAEIGRLLASMAPAVRENTIVIFLGDNGTSGRVIDRSVFASAHGKNSLYEGGVRVPLIIAGASVVDKGRRDASLVNTTDLFATVAELAGSATTDRHDSRSIAGVLRSPSGRGARTHNYVEFESTDVTGWAVRDAQFKLLHFADGREELYDLNVDLAEANDLLQPPGQDSAAIADALRSVGEALRL